MKGSPNCNHSHSKFSIVRDIPKTYSYVASMMHCTRFFGGAAFSLPDVKIKVVIALKLFVIYYAWTYKEMRLTNHISPTRMRQTTFQFITFVILISHTTDNL